MRQRVVFAAGLLAVAAASTVNAEIAESGKPATAGTWQFNIENDWVFAKDGNYTSGLFMGYFAPDLSLNFGQRMWTPESISHAEARPDDRPYAGLLFGEGSRYIHSDSATSRFSLMLGMVGPSAGAHAVQRETHTWFPAGDPKGWHNQIQDQAVFQLSWDRKSLLMRQSLGNDRQWEVSSYSRVAGGNYQSEARLGGMLRWGRGLQQSFSGNGVAPGFQTTLAIPDSGRGYYLFTGFEGSYHLNDITLQGRLPDDVPRVDLSPLQAAAGMGFIWYRPGWGISYKMILDSKDFVQDVDPIHGHGSIDILWRY